MLNFVLDGRQYYPLEVTYTKSLSQLGAKVKAVFPLEDNETKIPAEVGATIWVYEDWKNYFVGMITGIEASGDRLTLTAYDVSFWKIMVMGIIPVVFLVIGFMVWLKRRKA